MAELNVPIYDFKHGVLTPKLMGRPNIELYKSGVLVGENFLTQLHGPTQFRSGTVYSRTTRRNNIPFFVPFTFADDEAYTLSFTEGYLRFLVDGAVVTETSISITGITAADPGVLTAVGNTYVNGDEVYISGCEGMEDLNGQFYLVASSPDPGTSSKNWTFSNGANYTYGALVEITGGEAQLVNVPPYAITDPTIETNTGFPFAVALDEFVETATKPANTEIQYILSRDDGLSWVYWDGALWSASDETYTQSNTAATVHTNIPDLGIGTLKVRAFLHTTDNTATPQLDNILTSYTAPASDTFSLTDQDGNDIDTTLFDAYVGSGTVARVYEIASPYTEEDMPQVKFGQKADIMYLDHPSYAPRKITRTAHTGWTLLPYSRTDDPYGQVAITNISTAGNGRVTTGAAHGFITGDSILLEDVTGMTEVNHTIVTVTLVDATNFDINVDTSGYTAYASGGVAIQDGNCPAAVGFYGGRVFHGGSTNNPDILDGSMSPDPATGEPRYETFTLGASADDGVSYALTSVSTSSVDRIRFFMGTRQFLAVGTYAGMLKVNGGADSLAITGTAIESYPIDSFGVADMMPVNFGTDIIYVQRGLEVVYSFSYNILSDGFKSEDETIQSDEITQGGIKQITYQQGNPNQIWACMVDGRLLSFVYSDGEGVSSWNEHLLGGEGKVLTVAAQPQEDNKDLVVVAIEREVDGITRRYIEYFSKNPRIPERTDFYSGPTEADETADDTKYRNLMFYAQKRQVHLDSCLSLDTTEESIAVAPSATTGDDVTFEASASIFSATDLLRKIVVKHSDGTEQGIAQIIEYTSETVVQCKILQDFTSTDILNGGEWYFTQDSVSGLGHLEGETVSVVTDGGIHQSKVVTDGAITLNGQATYVMVGLPFYGRVKTMPLELLMSTGITPGKFKTVNKVNLLFRNALGVSYGTDPYDMQKIAFREGPSYTDRPPVLYNGMKEQPGFTGYSEQKYMWIVQTLPYPCTLTSMIFDMDFSEES